jgi:hypothetical protein
MPRSARMLRLPRAYTLVDRLFILWERLANLVRGKQPRQASIKLGLEGMEDRLVPDGRPLPDPVIFAGAGAGMAPIAKAFNAQTGELMYTRTVYDSSFTGGVNVATADFTGDGYPDLVVAPGAGGGGGPNVRILDGKTGEQVSGPLGSFWAFEESFTGGVRIATADVNEDGTPDVIAAAAADGGPRVRVFDGKTGDVISDFFAFDPNFTGGVSLAAVDFGRTGHAELVVGAGAGGGPEVRVFNPLTGTQISGPLGSFFAFDSSTRSGVNVGGDTHTGDANDDGVPDLIVGTGRGVTNEVKVFSGVDGAVLRDFTPFDSSFTGGVTVGMSYVDDDANSDMVVGSGIGMSASIKVFSGATGDLLPDPMGEYAPFDSSFTGGVNIAASNDPFTPTFSWISPGTSHSVVTQNVDWKVQVNGVVGQPTPTGTVAWNLFDLSTSTNYPLGSATLDSGGFAEIIAAGPFPFTTGYVGIDYSGDSVYTSLLNAASYAVDKMPTTPTPITIAPRRRRSPRR